MNDHCNFSRPRKVYPPFGWRLMVLLLLGSLMLTPACNPVDEIDFSADIKPIINKRCISCHGGVKKSGGLSLLFEAEAFAITESGSPAIVRGDANASEFIRRLHAEDEEERMPYEAPKLPDEEIELLTRWVNEGAKWGKHWAYTLPNEVSVPQVDAPSFVQHDIDRFVAAKLREQNLTYSAPAEPAVIARRVAFDLTGLPPKQTLFDAFASGKMDYPSYVDSLLVQPTYGEKWATWWLDLARYADSKGYEKDLGRTMWPYRDWVIKSLNADMPFDQFTIEQLAGDLLPNPTPDQLIATAFHRNTMSNDEGGTDNEEFRVAAVMDRLNTTYDVWQSTTMACVQCHSHPYDPFVHEEYYQSMAFFDNTRDEDTRGDEPVLHFYDTLSQQKIDAITDWLVDHGDPSTQQAYADFMDFKEPVYHLHRCTELDDSQLGADRQELQIWHDGTAILPNVVTAGATEMLLRYFTPHAGTVVTIRENNADGAILARFTLEKTGYQRVIRKVPFQGKRERMNLHFTAHNPTVGFQIPTGYIFWVAFLTEFPGQQQEGYAAVQRQFIDILNTLPTEQLPIMIENPDGRKRTTQFFERGNWLLKTDTVHPATPLVLNEWKEEWPSNRLGFAKWLVDTQNPLTARTIVNRVWHQIMGRGIVSTLEDLGTQSDPPSHAGLLDWLALRFMHQHQWSIKALIRDIVLSGTYRQSSKNSVELFEKDPQNQYYARAPRLRLTAEQVRDQALYVSGLLSDKMYGPGVMPPQPEGIWQTVYNGQSWVESQGEDRYRRGIYTYLKRTSPYPSFLSFDATSREVCTVRRSSTNTPLQALVTLNDPVYIEAAYHLAQQMAQQAVTSEQISWGYQRATYLSINDDQQVVLQSLYDKSYADFRAYPAKINQLLTFEDEATTPEMAALTVVANAIMNLDVFISKS